ncbi:MAG TPA: hypothetical protein VNR87_14075 [Flavisolibacter sp.]|nr:hypothetical protein [Flavisolibacter sp.]
MSISYQFSGGNLVLTSGTGISNYTTREKGKFQVRHKSGTREFASLVAATLFYSGLACRASIWDITEEPEMIESKFFVF